MMNEQAVSTPMCAHGYWKKIAKEKMMFTTVIEVGSAVLAADANSVVTSVLSTLATWVVVGRCGVLSLWVAVCLTITLLRFKMACGRLLVARSLLPLPPCSRLLCDEGLTVSCLISRMG